MLVWLRSERRQLWALLALALLLRLGLFLLLTPERFFYGGDGPYYVQHGWLIANRELDAPLTTVGPLYPLILAGVWRLFPAAPEPYASGSVPIVYLTSIRLIQVSLSVIMVWMSYRLTRRLGGSQSAAMVAALGAGLGPAFVLAPFYILTEPLFMALLTLGIWFYLQAQSHPSAGRYVLAGACMALASLTRPVALLLPLLLALHLLWVHGARSWRRLGPTFLGTFLVLILPWTVYLYRTSGNPLPEGFGSNLWIGAAHEGEWQGTITTSERSQEFGGERGDYIPEVLRIIRSDPLEWIELRTANLARAVLIPHGTSDLGGPSVKRLMGLWLHEDRSLQGLWSIIRLPSFTPKLLIYAFHYFALTFAVIGIVVTRPRWRLAFGAAAPILYLLTVHALLTATPRHLFPAEVFLWVFAGCGSVWLWRLIRTGRLRQRGSVG